MAAPLTPQWKTKIKIGSKIMFVKSPATYKQEENNDKSWINYLSFPLI